LSNTVWSEDSAVRTEYCQDRVRSGQINIRYSMANSLIRTHTVKKEYGQDKLLSGKIQVVYSKIRIQYGQINAVLSRYSTVRTQCGKGRVLSRHSMVKKNTDKIQYGQDTILSGKIRVIYSKISVASQDA